MQASMIPTATSDDDGLISMITRRTDDIHLSIHLSSINEMIMSPDLHLRLARMHRGGAAGEAATTVGLLAPLPLTVWNGKYSRKTLKLYLTCTSTIILHERC
jgi:hypothetical protein